MKYSLNQLRERMGKDDLELTCTRTVKADVSIWYSSDDSGILRERGVNITLFLSPEEDTEEAPDVYTFNMANDTVVDGKGNIIDVPLTIDDAAKALSIDLDAKVWDVEIPG